MASARASELDVNPNGAPVPAGSEKGGRQPTRFDSRCNHVEIWKYMYVREKRFRKMHTQKPAVGKQQAVFFNWHRI